jgi:hypothetical protein
VQEDKKAIQLLISGTNEIISHLQIHYLPSFRFVSFFHNEPIQDFSLWFQKLGELFQNFGFFFCSLHYYIYRFFIFYFCNFYVTILKFCLKTNIGTHEIAKINKSSFSTTYENTLLLISLSSNNKTLQSKQVS